MRNSDSGEISFYELIKSCPFFTEKSNIERHVLSEIYSILIQVDANVDRILAGAIMLDGDKVMQDLGQVLSSSSIDLKYNDAYSYNTQVNYLDPDLSSSDDTESETEDWAVAKMSKQQQKKAKLGNKEDEETEQIVLNPF